MTDVEIALTGDDLDRVRRGARLRQRSAFRRSSLPRYGSRYRADDVRALQLQETGCTGEYAVAKYLGTYWIAHSPNWRDQPADVGASIQVRTTPLGNGRLLIHPGDNDHQPFVLARTHRLPVVELVGWVLGADAKRAEWWGCPQPGRPCFVVPNGALAPMDRLGVRA